jgi:hypothetical protein
MSFFISTNFIAWFVGAVSGLMIGYLFWGEGDKS